MNWKAYEEVHFSDQYILRWVREGDEYVNRITKDMMEDLKAVVSQQEKELAEAGCLIGVLREKASHHEALAHAGGVEAGRELAQAQLDAAEQQVLDAFERGKMFGYAQGLRKAQEK